MLVEDGKGSGFKAQVTDHNMLRVYSMVETEMSHMSEVHGDAFIWSAGANWGADKNAIWLRNDNADKNLIIEGIFLGAVATAVISIYVGNGSTSGGTTVTGTNLNRGSGKIAEATCKHTNTNLDTPTDMTLVGSMYAPAGNRLAIDFKGALVLGYYDEVAVNIVTDIDMLYVNIMGYYHEVD
jgi:hypothetical protein